MAKQKSKVFKEEDHIVVYQKLLKPESVYKKYKFDCDVFKTYKDLEFFREKMIAIKNDDSWPKFVLKPTYISPLYEREFEREFIAEFPFIDGISLKDFLIKNNVDLKNSIEFISSLEKRIMSEKGKVFLDVANISNIMILPDEKEYVLIDPDDIQFGCYPSDGAAYLLGTKPMFSVSDDYSCGIKKCFIDKEMLNKQIDIRSMYALFYYILSKDAFYPIFLEKEKDEYIQNLKEYNVPEGSLLYRNTILTLSESDENECISNALYELLDAGYEFKVSNKGSNGYVYKLQKKRKLFWFR